MHLFNNKPKKIRSDEQLASLSKNDLYRRKKWVADAVTIVFIGLILSFGIFVLYWLINDQQFRDNVKTIVVNNLVGIIISGFIVIGFNVNKQS